ncbi:2Fe-2S iron-sulfur cluster binding domain-containing protein [Hydrogenophaga pseudoflava]|uniref:2Fe-2S iron-sulfur cluster binding domain-containing protein n=1 Tax=Hydrogenophaga pseudoflava TaxID=47421 RepID=UPI0027E54095|nr:2Fe-2S iron-sulfur cluster binding domain-containing protein [Hydrogenophaga pseudoflava]MDQ7745931.1 2Fe-2S iron-sulfur cluster binding domain-containing protein [Hydrogenophaga pseudoflava]
MSIFDTRPKFAVHVAQTDETFPCAANESLLTGMVRLGRKGIPVGCVNGGCGVCKVRILAGDIQALGPISRAHVSVDEECQGYTLACRVAPQTAVQLEVAGKLNKPFSKGRAESATASPIPQQQ